MRLNAFRLGVGACTASVLTFLLVQLTAWPPHEDETLALFVGRQSLGRLFHTVLNQRGGAPLHFCLAWIVAHAGGGLTELRLLSALFAAASVPAIAALGVRLATRPVALIATVLASGSWVLLFHGVYGRMYSLFLFTSALSYLTLLVALERGGRRRWALWVVATLLLVASHPYAALVVASQGVYVVLARRRFHEAAWAFAAVGVLGLPMWRSDIVLAGRFDVGVGSGGQRLGSPQSVLDYLWHAAGDFTAGYESALVPLMVLAAIGVVRLTRTRPSSALLAGAVIATPTAALLIARLGSSTSPQSRHLIFVLPFFTLLVASGLEDVGRRMPRLGPVAIAAVVAALIPAEIAWGWQKTPELYRGEPSARVVGLAEAAAWVAAVARPDDVLFGYEPVYLKAWEHARGRVSNTVVPRADAKLALKTLLRAQKPLGHGFWVFDASETTNLIRRLTIPVVLPDPPSAFEARAYGPFLVIRTRQPTVTVRRYLKLSRAVELLGECIPYAGSLCIGDAGINLQTVLQAGASLDRYEEASRYRSTVSR